MNNFWEEFNQFISFDCNREQFIKDFLNKNGIDCPVISLEGKNHLYVNFPLSQYNSSYKIKTIIAHYDRNSNTPGANDNSAAVFCILNWAVKIYKQNICHNVRIIFTDGEESNQNNTSVTNIGSFKLAQLFKKLNLMNDDIFVFDCMGRGDIPVICENNFSENVSSDFVKKVFELEKKTEQILKKASGGKWYKLKTAYSDNASFLANGIPCVAITMLPSSEINDYLKGIYPLTWQLFHTENDNIQSLTPNSFEIMQQILDLVALNKTLSLV